jgi:hypothetical protein
MLTETPGRSIAWPSTPVMEAAPPRFIVSCETAPDRLRSQGRPRLVPHSLGRPHRGSSAAWPRQDRQKGFVARLYTVGTWSLKAGLYTDLRKEAAGDVAPPGYCHFGLHNDEAYFRQFTAESLVENKKGKREWVKAGANHLLDCRVYATAVAVFAGLARKTADQWRAIARPLDRVPAAAADLFAPAVLAVERQEALAARPRRRVAAARRSRWRSRWRPRPPWSRRSPAPRSKRRAFAAARASARAASAERTHPMAGITLAQAQAQLDAWLAASIAISAGQSYTIAAGDSTRTLTRANLADVTAAIDRWSAEVQRLSRVKPRTRFMVWGGN